MQRIILTSFYLICITEAGQWIGRPVENLTDSQNSFIPFRSYPRTDYDYCGHNTRCTLKYQAACSLSYGEGTLSMGHELDTLFRCMGEMNRDLTFEERRFLIDVPIFGEEWGIFICKSVHATLTEMIKWRLPDRIETRKGMFYYYKSDNFSVGSHFFLQLIARGFYHAPSQQVATIIKVYNVYRKYSCENFQLCMFSFFCLNSHEEPGEDAIV